MRPPESAAHRLGEDAGWEREEREESRREGRDVREEGEMVEGWEVLGVTTRALRLRHPGGPGGGAAHRTCTDQSAGGPDLFQVTFWAFVIFIS